VAIGREDAAHLLRRAGFGGSSTQIDAVAAMDLPTAVSHVLDTSGAPASSTPAGLGSSTTSDYDQWVNGVQWWMERMRLSNAPVIEKLAFFWHGHFATSQSKINDFKLMFGQNTVFRNQGLGSFRTLAHAVSMDPAMILYLDNDPNVLGTPNENFARELMELFTLGVDQYTQADVVASARAWTGHGINDTTKIAEFHPAEHDGGMKTFFGKSQNWDGPQIIDEILRDNGAKKAIAARFVANKLWSWLAYPHPEPAVSDALTAAFLASNDLDITALLHAIFSHPQFFSASAKQGLVRTPADFMVAAMRATGISAQVAHPEWYMDGMSQTLFYPPNVAGWPQNGYWVSTSAVWARAGFARDLTWKAVSSHFLSDVPTLSVAAGVQRAFDVFGIVTPSPTTRTKLESWLTAERAANSGAQVPNLITLTMLTPEFQLA
jgi:uncharacterized protein (DUF1800 family)